MTSGTNTPNSLDTALGGRIRMRRLEINQTQDDLAHKIGVTFQQVQKYEHGANRVGFSRLIEIAKALKCSAAELIGPLDADPAQQPICTALAQPGAVDLLTGFIAIPTPSHRQTVLRLVRTLAGKADEKIAA